MCSVSEHKELLDSVERGWYELHSGFGELVAENDDFFTAIRQGMLCEKQNTLPKKLPIISPSA